MWSFAIGSVALMVQGDSTPILEAVHEIGEAARDSGSDGSRFSSILFLWRDDCGNVQGVMGLLTLKRAPMCYWYLDKTLGDRRHGRTRETWHNIKQSVERTARIVDAARLPASLGSGRMPVIISPGVMDSFIGHYIASNLSGENVAEGRSRFEVDQFHSGERVLRDDMQVILDTAVPMGPGSYPCTVEGGPLRPDRSCTGRATRYADTQSEVCSQVQHAAYFLASAGAIYSGL